MEINRRTKVIVQGITGRQGSYHTKLMLEYGTRIVAGVTPGKAGENIFGVPVFNTVKDALKNSSAEYSIIFVPAASVLEASMDALDNGLNLVIITEGVPVFDTLKILEKAASNGLIVIGPNGPGLTLVGECKLGIMPSHIFRQGEVSIISRSGTLTYEIVYELTRNMIGQRIVLGIGGDPMPGTDFIGALEMLKADPLTKKIVLIGEIGGRMEENAVDFIKGYPKKIVAYIAGRSAPEEKKMGHAGAIISGEYGNALSKIKALEGVGIPVAKLPSQIVELIKK